MIILTTTAAAQTLSVIPREYDNSEFAMSIRDDQTNVKVVYTSNTGVITGNYLQFSKAFFPVLVEGHFLIYTFMLTPTLGQPTTTFGICMTLFGT